MKRIRIKNKTAFKINESVVGEPLMVKLQRMKRNKEKHTAEAPLIYTEKADGVLPEYDIRADKWELAMENADAVSRVMIAKGGGIMPEIPENPQEGGGEES